MVEVMVEATVADTAVVAVIPVAVVIPQAVGTAVVMVADILLEAAMAVVMEAVTAVEVMVQ